MAFILYEGSAPLFWILIMNRPCIVSGMLSFSIPWDNSEEDYPGLPTPCCKTFLKSIRSMPRTPATKAKAWPVGQLPTVAWPQVEGKPLEHHVFLVRHAPLSWWHCQGDQSPEEATWRTDDTSSLKDFGGLFHQNLQPFLPPFPLYSSPLENTHAAQYPSLQTQDPSISSSLKAPTSSCLASQALPWDTAFQGTPQTAAPGAFTTTVGVWQAFPWPSLLLPGHLSPLSTPLSPKP